MGNFNEIQTERNTPRTLPKNFCHKKFMQESISRCIHEENTKIKFTDMTVANLKDQISRTKEVIEDKITKMNLWKVELTTYEADNLSAEDIESHERSEKMVTTSNLDKYFNNNEDKNPKKGYLHVFIVPTATDLGRKRRNTEVETTSRKRRSWAINSTIANELRDSVYFVDTTETSGPLRDMIQKGEFVALYGTRASGKSTRVDQAIFKLKSEGYVCIYVTLEGVNISTTDIFWSSLGTKLAINAPNYFKYNEVKSSDDFMFKFRKSNWESDVVFFIDEYDVLLEANDDIKSSFLGTIRNIKNSKRDYAILSFVAIGYYEQTNGHAGLVCLCGRAIQNNLEKKLDESRRLDFTLWSNFLATSRVTDIMIRIFRFCTN
ncbi:P-loop containing nucleoside triphosphate hydrolase protein [Rhizophagus irregularis DAOM 181602=DAOM 197198]|nr:P-loop containing nucleoside triphosphate hydrolase protein [Rhizophagus irregularis DAOM 181602=DAOM 197198]